MSPVGGQLHLVLTRTPGTAWKGNHTFSRLRLNVAAKSQAGKLSWIHFYCVNPDAINIYQLRHVSNTKKQILSWSLEERQGACLQMAAGLEHCGWKICGFTSAAFMVGWGDSNWFNVLVHGAILLILGLSLPTVTDSWSHTGSFPWTRINLSVQIFVLREGQK